MIDKAIKEEFTEEENTLINKLKTETIINLRKEIDIGKFDNNTRIYLLHSVLSGLISAHICSMATISGRGIKEAIDFQIDLLRDNCYEEIEKIELIKNIVDGLSKLKDKL